MLFKSIKCLDLIILSILSQDCKSYQHLKTKVAVTFETVNRFILAHKITGIKSCCASCQAPNPAYSIEWLITV